MGLDTLVYMDLQSGKPIYPIYSQNLNENNGKIFFLTNGPLRQWPMGVLLITAKLYFGEIAFFNLV